MTCARRRATFAMLTAAGLFLPISWAFAANVLWHTNSSGLFDEGANWSSGAMPGSADNAIFSRGLGVTYDVSFFGSFDPATANYLVDQWRVRSNNVSFHRALSAASLTAGNPSTGLFDRGIIVGETPDDVTVLTSFLNSLSAGAASIATGDRSTATLRLAGSQLNLTGNSQVDTELIVGHAGNGTLEILSHSSVTLSGANGNATLGDNAGSSGTMSLSGSGSTFSAHLLVIGRAGSGTLNVSSGGVVTSNLSGLGNASTARGAATIRGVGSSWSAGELSVSTGVLSIVEGGVVTADQAFIENPGGPDGSVIVHGAGSRWTIGQGLIVGRNGRGAVTVTAGGQLHAANATLGSQGAVIVDGAGSALTLAGTLSVVGSSGGSQGPLNISGGGAVQSGDAHLDFAASAASVAVTVTVGGGDGISTWDIDGELIVSEFGSAFLHLLSGGRVTHGEASIRRAGQVTVVGAGAVLSSDDAIHVGGTLSIAAGGNAFHGVANVTSGNSIDAATVAGDGSAWTVTELVVGADGLGTLNVTGGGQVTDSLAFVGDAAGSSGVVNVGAASTWTTTGDLTIGFGGAGTLNITGGGQVTSGDADVGARFGSDGAVNISGAGSAWTINGDLKLTGAGDSTLALGLSAATDNGLITADSAMLDGTLEVSLLDGFTPAEGNMFEILTADGGITGVFAEELLPALTGGLFWDIVYGTNSVMLAVAAPGLPGDYNRDGTVDAADYTVWRDSLGQTGTGLAADGNDNGQIDAGDYDEWKQNYGATLDSGAGDASVVPEPSAGVLLLAICAWIAISSLRAGGQNGTPSLARASIPSLIDQCQWTAVCREEGRMTVTQFVRGGYTSCMPLTVGRATELCR